MKMLTESKRCEILSYVAQKRPMGSYKVALALYRLPSEVHVEELFSTRKSASSQETAKGQGSQKHPNSPSI
jgi:hypothetical protein